jgi:hypothetical protein
MSVFHEQRICVKFGVKVGKSVTETTGLKRTSGGNVSKKAELRLMIRIRDGHQRRKVTIMLQKFVNSSVQIVV